MTTSIKSITAARALNRAQAAALKAGLCPCRQHDAWRDGLCVICLLRRTQGQPSGAAWAALDDKAKADQAAWLCDHPLTRRVSGHSGGAERDGAAFREIYSHGSRQHGMASATSGVNAQPAKRARRTPSQPSVRTMCAPGPSCCSWRGSERRKASEALPACRGCSGVLVEASEARKEKVS